LFQVNRGCGRWPESDPNDEGLPPLPSFSSIQIAVLRAEERGCASPHWFKLDSAGKTEPTQHSGDLRKALSDCSVVASATRLDLDTLFGSESAYAAFQKCMHDKGYTKS
jgi:hypothetical protein